MPTTAIVFHCYIWHKCVTFQNLENKEEKPLHRYGPTQFPHAVVKAWKCTYIPKLKNKLGIDMEGSVQQNICCQISLYPFDLTTCVIICFCDYASSLDA